MVSPDHSSDRLLDAALGLIAERGYLALSLSEVAKAAGAPLAQVYRAFSDKPAILDALTRRIDLAVLADAAETEGSARDRLFDLLMKRFEALAPYRDAMRVLYRELRKRPLDAARATPSLLRAMNWTLEAAGLAGSGGAFAPLRAPALAALYGSVVSVWLEDDDPGLSKTMAALDRRLRRAEETLLRAGRTVHGGERRHGPGKGADENKRDGI